jgi:hypothetical protein
MKGPRSRAELERGRAELAAVAHRRAERGCLGVDFSGALERRSRAVLDGGRLRGGDRVSSLSGVAHDPGPTCSSVPWSAGLIAHSPFCPLAGRMPPVDTGGNPRRSRSQARVPAGHLWECSARCDALPARCEPRVLRSVLSEGGDGGLERCEMTGCSRLRGWRASRS